MEYAMDIRTKIPKLGNKQRNRLFLLSLIMLSLAALLFPGSGSYVLFDDSGTYIKMVNGEGVMPLYPLFLFFNRLIWGVERYLQVVVLEQTLVATVCVVWFTLTIKRRFALKYWEAYLVLFLSVFPLTTDMPMAMTTQEILTEGLTYALFYVFAIFLFGAILDKDWKKWSCSFLFVFLLALFRSQLQILFAVCGVAVIYISFMKYDRKRILPLFCRMLLSIVICFAVMGAGVPGVIRLNAACQKAMYGNGALAELIRENELTDGQLVSLGLEEKEEAGEADGTETAEVEQPVTEAGAELPDEEADAGSGGQIQHTEDMPAGGTDCAVGPALEETPQKEKPAPNTHPEVIAFMNQEYEDSGISVSQYDSLIFSKGMYEADYEDYLLFEDELVQEQFLLVYEIADELGYRYPYAESGLWGWRNIANASGALGGPCFAALNDYFADYYNTTVVYFVYQRSSQAFRTIGLKLLTRHFGSFILHTLRLMPPAFIATVFFQKEQFYLLCHLITLFLYVSAAALTIWGFADKRAEKKYAEFMLGVLLIDFIMVIALSLIFIGLQRYLVYAFGIFYVGYLLLLKQLWALHGKRWFGHLFKRKG